MIPEKTGKIYELKNGYKICNTKFYDCYNVQYRWGIWTPKGELYMSCGSYNEAYELASFLKVEDM